MLWVLKRTISVRPFFGAPKIYAKKYWQENIYNFTQKNCLSKPVKERVKDTVSSMLH